MKNQILLIVCFFALSTHFASAQEDSTARKYQTGMAIYGEFGLLSNKSFDAVRDKMMSLDVKPFESVMASIVLAKRLETRRWFSEARLILMNSTNYTKNKNDVKGYFGGIGIGMDAGPKLVSTKHWNVLIPIGYDLMLYRMMIKNNQSATLGQVVTTPSSFQSAKFYTGNINLHGGIGVDYKININGKCTDKLYISSKVSYQLPLLTNKKWKGDDVTVSDLPSFKPNQLYFQIGLIAFPKHDYRMWKGMHHRM
ncbi:hypothetical protein DYBT9275_01354 [Dyadobacter sp. CECT 9275]|uniref:Uncharacterized protein n=1 Tax=Dyadobacter helix TaxID=2822344 RepID=A0A916JA46_9BACT|nr:hypothetical protein [Dyadobacter sp. CECT 9275]CAG4994257.1 hypothetical protein DYBT9275_01354 [Dyadobacter sp. CECT 9275]